MKLSCLQEHLNKGLSIVGRAVAVRSTLPQASHVLIATDEGRLKLAGTNLAIAITCWIGAKIEEEGSVTIPARLLTDFISTLPNEQIDFSVGPRGQQVKLVSGRHDATIAGMDAADFPPIPRVEDGLAITLEPQALRTAIAQVEFAAATDDMRPVLTGVHVLLEGKQLELAAADGFRLAVYRLALEKEVSERVEVIIPAQALRELGRLLAEQQEPVEVAFNAGRSQVQFRLRDAELVAQLVQGTFPNYSQLIPQTYSNRTVVSLPEFQRETRIAAIFARDGSGIIRLQVQPGMEKAPGQLTISAKAEEIGDHRGDIDASVDGEAAKIAFNSKYLQDVLQVLDCGQIALETTSPSSPGVIRPVGSDNAVHVVMPMFVQW